MLNKLEEQYHVKQFLNTYRSTEMFTEWLENKVFLCGDGRGKTSVLDMACGGGANTLYLANRHADIQFVGIDIGKEYIEYGTKMVKEYSKYQNCSLYVGNWFDIDLKWKKVFKGIVCFQTLFMFPDYRDALSKLIDLQPDWIAVSSLFYEGDIEYTNKFRDYYRPSGDRTYTDYYYNVHSIIRYRMYMEEMGYKKFEYIPFEIDIDIPKTESMDIGTYTVKTVEGKRIQISGGLMMPWYFVIAYK